MTPKSFFRTVLFIGFCLPALSATLAQDGVANLCESPSFNQPSASPFQLSPAPGVLGKPRAVATGNFFRRPPAEAPCNCDVAVALPTDNSPGSVAILRGRPDGSFSQELMLKLPAGETPQAVVKGRFKVANSGGLESVAVATSIANGPGRVRLFTPDNAGNYMPSSTSWPVGETPVAMAVGDYDGDGSLDVAVANQGNNKLTILLGAGDGFFADPVTVDLGRNVPNSIAVGRFSGAAAHDDIAVATLSPDPNDPAKPRTGLLLVRRDQSGTFKTSDPTLFGGASGGRQFIWVASANLTELTPANSSERHDLALAYLETNVAGNATAKIQVLLGKEDGGFTEGQLHDLGEVLPSSAMTADLDDDGIADLAVSTRGSSPQDADGTIRFFQGKTGAEAGFHTNPGWFTIPENFGIRPLSLAAGRFGPEIEGPDGKRTPVGLVVANAPNLNSLSVLLGNARGAFVQPTIVTTRLPVTSSNFLAGDFHSVSGDSYSDMAFINRRPATGLSTLEFLRSNGAGGFIGPDDSMALDVGAGPHLVLTGKFDSGAQMDIAVIDTSLDPVSGKPLLRLFLNRGEGAFARSITPLGQSDKPVAMATGHFSGQPAGAPLDIAVADASGKITVLVNDREGRFPLSNWRTAQVPFAPVAISASDNLNGDGRSDLVVKAASGDRFILLQNLGPVEAGESQFISGGFFLDTGLAPALLAGVIPGNAKPEELDHIVTYDNTVIKAFRANNRGSFDPVQVSVLPDLSPASAQAPYAIGDFGDGKPGLGAAVTDGEGLGVVQLRGDGKGSFTLATRNMAGKLDRGERLSIVENTSFERELPVFGETVTRNSIAAIAAPMRSLLHGNGKPDLALVTKLSTFVIEGGVCPTDPKDPPPDPPVPDTVLCHMEPAEFDEVCQIPSGIPFPPTIPGIGRDCPPHRVCVTIPAQQPPPFKAFCRRAEEFAPVVTVFANTCND